MTINGVGDAGLPVHAMCGKVLVADDEASILRAISAVLGAEGCSVQICGDGESALRLIAQEHFDVVISDIRMPGMTGLELLAQLRASRPELPVILISGYADLETAVAAVKEHAFDFILKPFHPEHIISTVRKAFEFRRLVEMEREYKGLLEETVVRSAVELRQYVEQLRQARNEAVEASRLKSQFIATISHEIRTPLNGIVGLLDLLMYKEQLPHQQEYFAMLKDASDYLSGLLGNILDFSKLSCGRLALEEKTFSLRQMLETAANMARVRARRKGLNCDLLVDDELPDVLIGDEARLNQVLLNLLDNAIKFTEQGGITLRVCSAENPGGGTARSLRLLFSVADTGMGIPYDCQSAIFESFIQGDGSHTKQHGGAGLGLSLARQIVESMDGVLTVESEEGKGSNFTFIVTLQRGGLPV